MNILLIHPPFYRTIGFYNRYFPFGLVTLATFLRTVGFADVCVYDADFNERPEHIDYSELPRHYPRYLDSLREPDHPVWREVEETIRQLKPDVVGISVWTTFAAASFHTALIARRVHPGATIVMGGPHASARAGEILGVCQEVDFVIRGEGEHAFHELVSALRDRKPERARSIAGVSFRSGGGIHHEAARAKCVDINEFSFPDRHLLMNESSYTPDDMGLIMASRGCPYSCTYCATDTKRVVYRSIDHILSEIRHVRERYGASQITFKDDSFTVNRSLVEDLCNRLLAERLDISWECNTRVNLVSEPLLRLMKRAGCNFIKVGIESGSERVLRQMKKGITHDQVRAAAKLFRKVGIHWTAYFMMGVPGETEEDVWKTADMLEELRPDFACIGVYEPFPGTAMFEEGVALGLVKPEMTLEDYNGTLPNHYYRKRPAAETTAIGPERFAELERLVKKKVHDYNGKMPRIVAMARARSRIYRNSPRLLWEDFRKYLSYSSGP